MTILVTEENLGFLDLQFRRAENSFFLELSYLEFKKENGHIFLKQTINSQLPTTVVRPSRIQCISKGMRDETRVSNISNSKDDSLARVFSYHEMAQFVCIRFNSQGTSLQQMNIARTFFVIFSVKVATSYVKLHETGH